MSLESFVRRQAPVWHDLERALADPDADRARRARLYRGAVADLAEARRRWPDSEPTMALEALVARSTTVVLPAPTSPSTGFSAWRLAQRSALVPVAVVLAVGLVAVVAGRRWANDAPVTAARFLPRRLRPPADPFDLWSPWRAMAVAAAACTGVVTRGIGAMVAIGYGGACVGLAWGLSDRLPVHRGGLGPSVLGVAIVAGAAAALGWSGRRPQRGDLLVLATGIAALGLAAISWRTPIWAGGVAPIVWAVAVVAPVSGAPPVR